VENYSKKQDQHHRNESLLDEYTRLLREADIGFDERYLELSPTGLGLRLPFGAWAAGAIHFDSAVKNWHGSAHEILPGVANASQLRLRRGLAWIRYAILRPEHCGAGQWRLRGGIELGLSGNSGCTPTAKRR